MFGTIRLQYYLDENTYRQLYERFGLSKSNQTKQFTDSPITEISLLDIVYDFFGHTHFFWIMVDINTLYGMEKCAYVPMDVVDTDSFYRLLLPVYEKTFGSGISKNIAACDYQYCTYIEYMALIKTADADSIMNKLRQGSFAAEQLDIQCFDSYRLKNAYVTFTVNQLGPETLRLCAKIPGTALKRIFKTDSALVDGHVPHTQVSKVLSKEKAAEVLYKQLVKYAKPHMPPGWSEEMISSFM